METYVAALRRFGDWLGASYPEVTSVADVRRHHIESYKQAVVQMNVGDYANSPTRFGWENRQKTPLSAYHRIRCISCVKAFFDMI